MASQVEPSATGASSSQAPSPVPPSNVSKPKQSKSRNGCRTCKEKRLKCDEAKPICHQCQRRGVDCKGYTKEFKWRNFSGPTHTNLRSCIPGEGHGQSDRPSAPGSSSKPAGEQVWPLPPVTAVKLERAPSISHTAPCSGGSSVGLVEASTARPPSCPSSRDAQQLHRTLPFVSPIAHVPPPACTLTEDPICQANPQQLRLPSGTEVFPSTVNIGVTATNLSSSLHIGSVEPVPPHDDVSEGPHMQYPSSSTHQIGHFGAAPHPSTRLTIEMENPQVTSPPLNTWNQSLTGFEDQTVGQEAHSSQAVLHGGSRLHMIAPELLFKRYLDETCGILSLTDGRRENPWRTLIFPMIHENLAVHHALSAMTAFHGSVGSTVLQQVGKFHFKEAITVLSEQVQRLTETTPDLAIAAIVILAFAESWDRHVSTGRTHLLGARAIIGPNYELRLKQAYRDPTTRKRIDFLRNVWVYLDVLARLTPTPPSRLDLLDQRIGEMYMPVTVGNESRIDPLLGCAATLFPLLARVANLANRVRNEGLQVAEHREIASNLQRLLLHWQCDNLNAEQRDEFSSIQDLIHTADAYRWAALLLLHQSVTDLPSLYSAELSRRCLASLGAIDLGSRTVIVHVFPLTAAGCEAISPEQRASVSSRWVNMIARLKTGNVIKAYQLVQETWRRRSAYEAIHGLLTSPPSNFQAPTLRVDSGISKGKGDFVTSRSSYGRTQDSGTQSCARPDLAASGAKRTFAEALYSEGDTLTYSMPFSKRVALKAAGLLDGESVATLTELSFNPESIAPQTTGNQQARVHRPIVMRSSAGVGEARKRTSRKSRPLGDELPVATDCRSPEAAAELLPAPYTVSGELHWLQVMADNAWEILLG